MKNLLIPIFAFALFSCSSDRDSDSVETNVVGIWKMEKTTTVSGKDNATVLREDLPDDCKQKSTYEFTNDRKLISNDYNNVSSECQFTSRTTPYTFNKNENTLTIGQDTSKVLELSGNRLVIYLAGNYDSNNDGINDFLRYTFKR